MPFGPVTTVVPAGGQCVDILTARMLRGRAALKRGRMHPGPLPNDPPSLQQQAILDMKAPRRVEGECGAAEGAVAHSNCVHIRYVAVQHPANWPYNSQERTPAARLPGN